MRPLNLVVVLLHKVGFTLLTSTDSRVFKVEVTAIFVSLNILRYSRNLPRTEGVDTSSDSKVHIVAYGEVPTNIADKETLGILTVCWHQNTRLRTIVDREECLWDTWKVDRYILHNQVGIACDNLLTRDDLGLGHGDVEVRMVGAVTCGVHTISDMDRLVGVHLHAATDKPAIALLCCNTLNLRLTRVEVVGDGVHRVWRAAIRELWVGRCRSAVDGVGRVAVCKDILGLHIDTHKVGFEVHALICYIATLVAVNHIVAGIEYHRVDSLTLDDVCKCCTTCAATL